MSLMFFRPRRRRPLGPWLADLRELASVILAGVGLAVAAAVLKHFGVPL